MGSRERFETLGKWIAEAKPVEPGCWYDFRASYCQEGVESERVSIVAMLTWLGKGPRSPEVRREYVEHLADEGGGWRALRARSCAPPKSTSVRIELFLRWTERGRVWWREVDLRPSARQERRIVRAAAVYDPTVWGQAKPEHLRRAEAMIDRIGPHRPDVICLTENFTDRGTMKPVAQTAERVPGGPGSRLLARKARQYRCYISASIHEKEGGLYYNTAALFDRRGRLAGKYRKVQISLGEAEKGITPGRDFPVFETDFGKVGMLICWDNSFAEATRILALRGAEMVLLSIAGDGVPMHWETVCRARAMENVLHLVGSLGLRGPSWIMAPDGRILASTCGGFALADCDLDARPETLYLSVGGSMGDHRSVYLVERRSDAFGPLVRSEDSWRIAAVPDS
jgi:predicted amidohydrolase